MPENPGHLQNTAMDVKLWRRVGAGREPYLACLVVKPNQGVIPGQHLAVERGVVLRGPTPSHRPADLDGLIQVDMSLLERVRVGSAGEHG